MDAKTYAAFIAAVAATASAGLYDRLCLAARRGPGLAPTIGDWSAAAWALSDAADLAKAAGDEDTAFRLRDFGAQASTYATNLTKGWVGIGVGLPFPIRTLDQIAAAAAA